LKQKSTKKIQGCFHFLTQFMPEKAKHNKLVLTDSRQDSNSILFLTLFQSKTTKMKKAGSNFRYQDFTLTFKMRRKLLS